MLPNHTILAQLRASKLVTIHNQSTATRSKYSRVQTLLLRFMPDTEYAYMTNFPPLEVDGEHSELSGSCPLPQLWPDNMQRDPEWTSLWIWRFKPLTPTVAIWIQL